MRSNSDSSICRVSSGIIERSAATIDASRPVNGRARKVLRFSGWANTATADVDGYIIEPESFSESLSAYRKNPLILHNHHNDRVIGRAEKLNIVSGQGLSLTGLIDMEDDYARAIGGQVERGYIRGMSVGFQILESPRPAGGGRLRFPKNRLLEISVVALPANPEALVGDGAELAEVVRQLRRAAGGASLIDGDESIDLMMADLGRTFARERERKGTPTLGDVLALARSIRMDLDTREAPASRRAATWDDALAAIRTELEARKTAAHSRPVYSSGKAPKTAEEGLRILLDEAREVRRDLASRRRW